MLKFGEVKKLKETEISLLKSRKIAPFKAIAVGGNFEVIIDKAQTETAQITADEICHSFYHHKS